MHDRHPSVPVVRPGLHTNGDFEAWAEQYRFLSYVLRMSSMQIAQIDLGYDPDHPDAHFASFYAHQIERDYPVVDVSSLLGALGRWNRT